MAKFELKLPKMGESVAEATVTNWLKKVGDKIEKGQRLGRIHLGSTVVVDVPDQLTPAVNIGDIVVAGESILFKADELKKIGGEK